MTYHLLIDDKSVWLNMAELVTLKNTIETAIQSGFKEGDFLLFDGDYDLVTIFAAYTSDGSWHEHASISLGSMELQTGLHITANDCEGYNVRQASDEEKKILLDALDEHGYAWNPETKKVEKPKKPVFEIGRFYVFNEDDEDGELTIIGKLIDKNESEDTLTFGDQYEIENQKFVTDQTFDLRISVHNELREATDGEILMLQKARTLWKKEKQAKEQPAFKPFDKVLVRDNKEDKWKPAFFVKISNNEKLPYNCVSLVSGHNSSYKYCIPYEGHENFAFTDYDFVDLPF